MPVKCLIVPICWSYQPVMDSTGTSVSWCVFSKLKWSVAWSASQLRQRSTVPARASTGMSARGRYQSHFERSFSTNSLGASSRSRTPIMSNRMRVSTLRFVTHQVRTRPRRNTPESSRSSRLAAIMPGTIVTRCGGRVCANAHCVQPSYELPHVPTRPFDHGCAAAHSTVS